MRDKFPEIRIPTHRSGIFKFMVGVDFESIQPLIDRVEDAKKRFQSTPILPEAALQIQNEVLVSSVFGTNTIEGGTLTEEETAALISGEKTAVEEKETRVTNIRTAYAMAEHFSQKVLKKAHEDKIDLDKTYIGVALQERMVTDLHRTITEGLTHPKNTPGQYRNNQKGELTKVGDAEHGGVYVAPKCLDDIKLLITNYFAWINSDEIASINPLIRAPLVHYYFERIHPFWDGNGRVGRVLESIVLKSAGFKYAHFAMAKYYLENIDEYFTVFNTARINAEKNVEYPNTVFIDFFLRGLLKVINALHDRVNVIVGYLLFDVIVNEFLQQKKINTRQFTIIHNLKPKGIEHNLDEVQKQPWYKGLYEKLTNRTQYRDLTRMENLGLINLLPKRKLKLIIPGQ